MPVRRDPPQTHLLRAPAATSDPASEQEVHPASRAAFALAPAVAVPILDPAATALTNPALKSDCFAALKPVREASGAAPFRKKKPERIGSGICAAAKCNQFMPTTAVAPVAVASSRSALGCTVN